MLFGALHSNFTHKSDSNIGPNGAANLNDVMQFLYALHFSVQMTHYQFRADRFADRIRRSFFQWTCAFFTNFRPNTQHTICYDHDHRQYWNVRNCVVWRHEIKCPSIFAAYCSRRLNSRVAHSYWLLSLRLDRRCVLSLACRVQKTIAHMPYCAKYQYFCDNSHAVIVVVSIHLFVGQCFGWFVATRGNSGEVEHHN